MANSQTGTISYSIVGCRMIMIEVAAASHYINWISITLTFVILVVVITSIANTSPIIRAAVTAVTQSLPLLRLRW